MKKMNARGAYREIRKWYVANVRFFEDMGIPEKMGERGGRFLDLVNKMPPDSQASDAEIKVILLEVSRGVLEVCFKGSDGSYMMGQYARAGLESLGDSYETFSPEEIAVLRVSKIGPSLTVL